MAEEVFAVQALRQARADLAIAMTEDYEFEKLCRSPSISAAISSLKAERRSLEHYVARLEGGAVAERPKRWMPTVKKIAAHWDLPTDVCWRCGKHETPLERAHLICRALDGLDAVQNLGLLCSACHRAMPAHWPGDEQQAIRYTFVSCRPLPDADTEPVPDPGRDEAPSRPEAGGR